VVNIYGRFEASECPYLQTQLLDTKDEGVSTLNTGEPGYDDIGLCDTSSIASDIQWYQLIPHC
jgi:hypothetical protein